MDVFPHEHAQCATWMNYRTTTVSMLQFYCGLDDRLGEDIYDRSGPI